MVLFQILATNPQKIEKKSENGCPKCNHRVIKLNCRIQNIVPETFDKAYKMERNILIPIVSIF